MQTLTHHQIVNFITQLRESHVAMSDVFLCGSCYHLFAVLRAIEPSAKPWYKVNPGHVYTEIGGRFYDILGAHTFTRKQFESGELVPLFRHRWYDVNEERRQVKRFNKHRRPDRWRDRTIKRIERKLGFEPSRGVYWDGPLGLAIGIRYQFLIMCRHVLYPFRLWLWRHRRMFALLKGNLDDTAERMRDVKVEVSE